MKVLKFTFILVISVFMSGTLHGVEPSSSSKQMPQETLKEVASINNLDKKVSEAQLYRKRSFKEKIAVHFLKKKIQKEQKKSTQTTYRKTHGMAIAGFICSLVGIFVAGILLGILGIVFSAIAMGQINQQPKIFKGKGLAIVGLVIGIIALFGAVIVLAAI